MDDLYIGLMSGTSVDSVDAVLVDLSQKQPRLIQTHAEPFPERIHSKLQKLIKQQQTSLEDLAELDHAVAALYALVVKKILQLANTRPGNVKAIGAHGQTIYHQAEGEHPNSLQIGDPSFIAEHTGINVVADFRRHDMAVGGQGAPLVPAFNAEVFRDKEFNRVILNIGGIANITVLPADENKAVGGFDTGPGNTLLDLWAKKHINNDFDYNGNWSKQGSVSETLLQKLLDDPYFKRPPPKSTGREYFNFNWLEQFNLSHFAAEDVQATLSMLTVNTIANAIKEQARGTNELFIYGGGFRNDALISGLEQALPSIRVSSTENIGIAPDWVEATAFAWLAKQAVEKQPANLPTVTGARHPVILGGIYPGKL